MKNLYLYVIFAHNLHRNPYKIAGGSTHRLIIPTLKARVFLFHNPNLKARGFLCYINTNEFLVFIIEFLQHLHFLTYICMFTIITQTIFNHFTNSIFIYKFSAHSAIFDLYIIGNSTSP